MLQAESRRRRKTRKPAMFEAMWRKAEQAISGEEARRCTLRINEHAQWCEFESMVRTAEVTAEMMREAGLEEVELIETPADGQTAYGGWVNPEFWHVEAATLEIVEPRVEDPVLADYRSNPCSLMLYSRPTPPAGIAAELIAVDESDGDVCAGRDLTGRIVLTRTPGIRRS